ncbi:MAG: inorganic phosphate transporter, partial [Bacteroidia bacterium]
MFGLTIGLTIFLITCLLLACFFEFINGFHDTANAVATVIYTNTLKPTVAVVWSGIWNFTGVITGGIAVAMGIVNLLPMEVLVDSNVYHGIAMILALLISAIIWNFGTWFLGIPSSSSHTVIGAILGIGIAFYFLPDSVGGGAVNWDKAKDTGLALLISPIMGFAVAIVIMYIFKRLIKNEYIYKEPIPGKTPPIWIRVILTITCTLVSFFHGQNDGQKGVGLIMMILIGILPGYFSIDKSVNLQTEQASLKKIEALMIKADTTVLSGKELKMYQDIYKHGAHYDATVKGGSDAEVIPVSERFSLRKDVVKITKGSEKLISGGNLSLSANELKELKAEIKAAKKLVEYAPSWVIIMISLSLGMGTMVGWKRIVITVGEKIG